MSDSSLDDARTHQHLKQALVDAWDHLHGERPGDALKAIRMAMSIVGFVPGEAAGKILRPLPYEEARASDDISPHVDWDEDDYDISLFIRGVSSDVVGARRIRLVREGADWTVDDAKRLRKSLPELEIFAADDLCDALNGAFPKGKVRL